MPSRIDEAGHTKAFDDPVAEHWGESQRAKQSLVGLEPTSAHTYESEIQRSTTYATPTSTLIWYSGAVVAVGDSRLGHLSGAACWPQWPVRSPSAAEYLFLSA